MSNVFVKYYDMPCTIKAYTRENDDGSYTIVINSKLSFVQQLDGYEHEMSHIYNDDFDEFDIDYLEYIAHGGC